MLDVGFCVSLLLSNHSNLVDLSTTLLPRNKHTLDFTVGVPTSILGMWEAMQKATNTKVVGNRSTSKITGQRRVYLVGGNILNIELPPATFARITNATNEKIYPK